MIAKMGDLVLELDEMLLSGGIAGLVMRRTLDECSQLFVLCLEKSDLETGGGSCRSRFS